MSALATQPTAVRRLTKRPVVQRVLWNGLQAGIGALASVVSGWLARLIWTRVFGKAPPG
jgi:demethoxyubiquinone hydroxylase (CLK1/Coq7/Cat5 family)